MAAADFFAEISRLSIAELKDSIDVVAQLLVDRLGNEATRATQNEKRAITKPSARWR